jgi:2-phospho-L-lactate guanylyltransferase
VAIKSRAQCKSRLAHALSTPARLALVRAMLATVLDAVSEARCVQDVLVISPEREGVPSGMRVLADSGQSLNAALSYAHAQLQALGHAEALILPADLPHLTGQEIDAFVQAGRARGFAIAPDHAHRGTNALFMTARTPFTFRFGADSLRLHLEEACARGFTPAVVELPGLALDVDEPVDLQALAGRYRENLHEEAAWQTPARL